MSINVTFTFPIKTPVVEIVAAIQEHYGLGGALSTAPQLTAQHTATPRIEVPGSNTPLPAGAGEPAAPEVDGEGYVWDARIHSSSKALNENGKWRLRKGVSPTTVTQIKAELARARPGSATPINTPHDDEAKRAARLAWCEQQAFAVAGQRTQLSDAQFDALKIGKMVEVAPAGLAWFSAWQTARNEAYGQYVEGASMTPIVDPLDPSTLNAAALFGGAPGNASTVGDSKQAPVINEETFAGLSVLLAKSKAAGKITQVDIESTLAQLGMSSMGDLAKQPELVPACRQMFAAFFTI